MMKQTNLYYLFFFSDNTADVCFLHAHGCAIYMSDTNMVPTITNGKKEKMVLMR
jgi:hypothetical protein